MRKQYHLRPSPDGLRAWDVDDLIALAKDQNLPIIQVPLSAIRELDEPYWFSHESDSPVPTCRAIAEHAHLIYAADLSFPAILSADGRVMDGMHRIAKAAMLGLTHIVAVQFTTDPPPTYVGVQPDDLPY